MSYESSRDALDKIIADFRIGKRDLGDNRAQINIVRNVAIRAIMHLGYTEGDAMRWLR